MDPIFANHSDGFAIKPSQNPYHRWPILALKHDTFSNAKLHHRFMSPNFSKHAKPCDDFLVQRYQFTFRKQLKINGFRYILFPSMRFSVWHSYQTAFFIFSFATTRTRIISSWHGFLLAYRQGTVNAHSEIW